MATATTWATIWQRIMRELDLGIFIPNADFGAAAAGSITSRLLADVSASETKYSGWGIARPLAATAANADDWRIAGNLTPSSGLLAHTGANYSDITTTSEYVGLWNYQINPFKELLDAANRTLEFVYFDTYVALSHLSDLDGDMAAATDTNWTDVGTPTTSAKATTARRTPYGARSYNLINDAANEGTRSALVGVRQSRQVRGYAISSANVGTASLQIWDVTNSTGLGTAITHSEEAPQLMDTGWQSASTMKEVALYMLGTTDTSDIFWNQAWLYLDDTRRLPLPSYVQGAFMAPSIFRAIPVGAQTNSCWDADSLEMVELKEGYDYRFQFNQPDANPSAVIMLRQDAFFYPLFVQARLPYSEKGLFTGDTSETTCPMHQFMPRFKAEVLKSILIPRFPSEAKWKQFLDLAEKEGAGANAVRPKQKIARPLRWAGPVRM